MNRSPRRGADLRRESPTGWLRSCLDCGEFKPEETAFYRNNGSFNPRCRDCNNVRQKAAWAARREREGRKPQQPKDGAQITRGQGDAPAIPSIAQLLGAS